MRVRLRGINAVTKKARGRYSSVPITTRGRADHRCASEPGTAEFIASYNEAVARKVVPPSGTLLSVLAQYQASEHFHGLADSTRGAAMSR